ncbi:class I SAM-dependent methyltransferase [Patulibacter brassicae]|uniref:Class I SAM-dependent methyltransferase n=1 Tax=Patulibacter brassicae TaxID=1705717 RepID=A0ABU4VEA4_9ACTN|nr:class I SAM-dependent methyltransferase [Patulibacter brassicae]MDX8150100.1 class I SAM-dependent methyltransferase [Patulibacter brassicae]
MSPPDPAADAGPVRDADLDHVRWHDLECGGYRADLELWRAMAADRSPGRILDLGCGTGRVALDLAGAGHEVLGLDIDPVLVAELRRRAALRSLPAGATVGDAAAPRLAERFGLVLAPMQTIQLLGTAGRRGLLRALPRLLAPGARAAIALVEDVEPFDAGDALTVAPDMRDHEGTVYASRPVAVTVSGDGRIVLERVREIVGRDGERTVSGDRIALDVLPADRLEDEARDAGLRVLERREVPATEDHVASAVVVLAAVEEQEPSDA